MSIFKECFLGYNLVFIQVSFKPYVFEIVALIIWRQAVVLHSARHMTKTPSIVV